MIRRLTAVAELTEQDERAAALIKVLRQELRVDRFQPPPGHFLTPKRCAVRDCPGEQHASGLCRGHRGAWVTDGRPDVARWAADPDNDTVGWVAPVRGCPVVGCQHARGPFRLCEEHRRRFTRMGITGATTDEYVATNPPVITRVGSE